MRGVYTALAWILMLQRGKQRLNKINAALVARIRRNMPARKHAR